MSDRIRLSAVVPDGLAGKRLDQALSLLLPEHSRACIQRWIKRGDVRVDGRRLRPRDVARHGARIEVDAAVEAEVEAQPEAIPLDVVFEDESLIVVNKPAGLVVHPGAGNPRHTLMNALLHHDHRLRRLPRAGIVHRLDQYTSGLLVIARTLDARAALVGALQERAIWRQYIAIVGGVPTSGGVVNAAIGRHPTHRTKMAITERGRAAETHYRIIKKYRHHAMLSVDLETGRTHQIRVHMASLNHPLVGDPTYNNRRLVKGTGRALAEIITAFPRQALHAHRIELVHPHTHKPMAWRRDIPADMAGLVDALEADAEI